MAASEFEFKYNLEGKVDLRGTKMLGIQERSDTIDEQEKTTSRGGIRLLVLKPLGPPPWPGQKKQVEAEPEDPFGYSSKNDLHKRAELMQEIQHVILELPMTFKLEIEGSTEL